MNLVNAVMSSGLLRKYLKYDLHENFVKVVMSSALLQKYLNTISK